MKKWILLLFILSNAGPVWAQNDEAQKYFQGLEGCFILYNMKTSAVEKVIGDERCQQRLPPCSTFKVPLAVMAFDSGVLKDEAQVLTWDGKINEREVANHDQDARTWMKDSIVWFSQRLTPQIGEKKLKDYLRIFHYGNEDLTAGITQAWLVQPDAAGPALKISAYEQVEFMKALWSGALPASKQAIAMVKDITYLETSPQGFRLSGKTGSNYYNNSGKKRLGWFIAHIDNGQKQYVAVTNFSDLLDDTGSSYGGVKAKEITKQILNDQGLW
jgi:beta-lactamase class D